MPGTPTDMSSSRSSKTSSAASSPHLCDLEYAIADVANFEEIGLGDDTRIETCLPGARKPPIAIVAWNDARMDPRKAIAFPSNYPQRDLKVVRCKPAYPSLRGQIRNPTKEGLGIIPFGPGRLRRGVSTPMSTLYPLDPQLRRNRSFSPNPAHLAPLTTTSLPRKTSRGNMQGRRKSVQELEQECDDDVEDEVPDECMLENIPMSPRPVDERSRPTSATASPERPLPKERVKSIGNGTSHIPAEQGELRPSRISTQRGVSMGQFHFNHNNFKPRAKSWTDALSELNDEAKALTEALEAHADETPGGVPAKLFAEKGRVKSAFAELPPLRRAEITVDPFPISKEKEAVLSRTRPSWLPPKDPAEEKRHVKEYQKMMAMSAEAEKRKEAERDLERACRDDTANSLLKIWEEHVLPNWNVATAQKRTRDLWWKGIAPRSRGVIWAKAIGNELGLSQQSYMVALRRAQALDQTIKQGSQLEEEEERKKAWLIRIEEDAAVTYPELRIFQSEGPLHQSLLDVLKAYAMYRSDVGYVPGTNTIAALFLLNMSTPTLAFLSLANLLNRALPMSFHTSDPGAIARTYSLTMSYVSSRSERLYNHLTSSSFHSGADTYLRNIYSSLLTSILDLDCATRLWDIMVFEGDAALARAAVAVLLQRATDLCASQTVEEMQAILSTPLKIKEDEWIKLLRDAGRTKNERGRSESVVET